MFPKLALFVIACLDPRVDPAHVVGLELSDAIVVRNVGGRVTPEVTTTSPSSARSPRTSARRPALRGHRDPPHPTRTPIALADEAFRRRYADRIGADQLTLRDRAVIDPAATVASDVQRLRSETAIPARVSASGHVYDVVTGLVETIVSAGGA